MSPRRIQRQRVKGWRMPEGAVYVGRPSRWGNEFAVGEEVALNIGGHESRFTVRDRAHAVALYRNWQAPKPVADHPLRGKDLACWCPLVDAHGDRVPCHADVLLRLANPGLVIS